TDATRQVYEQLLPLFPVPLKYLFEPVPGLHNGRNTGAKEAKGSILAYLDDDMTVSEHWIRGVELIRQNQADAVAGKILPIWEGSIPEWAYIIYDGKISGHWGLLDLGKEMQIVKPDMIPGGNSFIKRQIVIDLKGFNPDGMPSELIKYRGDGETGFYNRFKAMNYVCMYDPIAVAHHMITKEKLTLEYICERSFRQGISASYSEIRKAGKLSDPIFLKINDAYKKGMIYHREEVIKDPSLLEWIIKDNYL
ncbi:MAG: glycosyltransferase, partial [Desulfobacterales bacterium]|nr:glycosyltransferase [Desulfobacterales bacterium]